MGFFGDVDVFAGLVLHVQVDVIENFFSCQVHVLYDRCLGEKLGRLADQKLAHCDQLLFCE